MDDELHECGQIVVVQNGNEGGLEVHHNVPCEFARSRYLVRM